MKLWNLFDMDLYRQMVLEKYVRVNKYQGLSILTYSETAQFEQKWNEVTRQCRGLVIDNHMNVLARPWDKFKNYGQDPLDEKLLDWPVDVTDKMDGSLGIWFAENDSYPSQDRNRTYQSDMYFQDRWHMVTKGSFISDQAVRGAEMMQRVRRNQHFDSEWTYMFEIIYPDNRIVLDYGDRDELVLLGARNIETGFVRAAKDVYEWLGPKATTFPYKTLREAIEAPDRANAEGFVVYFPDFDYRIKIKQEDYMKLHREVTGLTSRKIWKRMKAGESMEIILDIVPDEWHPWLKEKYDMILDEYTALRSEIYEMADIVFTQLPNGWTRADLAVTVKLVKHGQFLFSIYENRDIDDVIWDMVYPPADPK